MNRLIKYSPLNHAPNPW